MRLALIGAGRWGRNYIRTIASLPDVELVRLASANPDSRALVPPGCAVEADWRAVVAAPDVDGVIVSTPPATHAEITLAAIAAGKPVLVEKPLTLDPAEAETIAAAARDAGATVMVDHIHLYNPAFRRLLELATTLGSIREIRGWAGNRGPYRPDSSPLWDWGAHDLAMIGRMLGTVPLNIRARHLERALVNGMTAENIELALTYPDGVAATCIVGTLMDRRRDFMVHCTGGTLLYDDLAPVKLTLDGQPVEYGTESPLACVVREFTETTAGRRQPDDGLELGVAVVGLLARAGAALAQSSSSRP